MKMIIGLGNPETQYTGTRHNVGFALLDEYAHSCGVNFTHHKKLKADVATLSSGENKILLVKPQTFYDLSGEAGRAVADFYKIDPGYILIIHDELALPFGTIRTRIGGSDGGNNGIKSLNQHLGTQTARLRVGIANELRERVDDAAFVLGKFTKDENDSLSHMYEKVARQITDFTNGTFTVSTHR